MSSKEDLINLTGRRWDLIGEVNAVMSDLAWRMGRAGEHLGQHLAKTYLGSCLAGIQKSTTGSFVLATEDIPSGTWTRIGRTLYAGHGGGLYRVIGIGSVWDLAAQAVVLAAHLVEVPDDLEVVASKLLAMGAVTAPERVS